MIKLKILSQYMEPLLNYLPPFSRKMALGAQAGGIFEIGIIIM
jgi:hypothetical protein